MRRIEESHVWTPNSGIEYRCHRALLIADDDTETVQPDPTCARCADEQAGISAAALGARGGAAGRGQAKRRNVDYAALGRKGARARKRKARAK